MNIAMWSGPRNLSTAMMYSFAQRSDFSVVDEPFYGAYLAATGLEHPMRDDVLSTMEHDPVKVAAACVAGAETPHGYQKHMTHHMVPGFRMDWLAEVVNVFLVRHPARVIASYAKKRDSATLADIGFSQQLEIFQKVIDLGQTPLVVDSHDIRESPERGLRQLCQSLELPFDNAMLSWPEGGIAEDGVWAAHWYDAVHKSTGFADAEGPLPRLEGALRDLELEAMPAYDAMKAHVI